MHAPHFNSSNAHGHPRGHHNPQHFTRCKPLTSTPPPQQGSGVIPLLDPAFRSGLLQVPIEKTLATKGRDEWLAGRLQKDLSVCCLFQKGRCHAQDRCFQVHVDRAYMETLRDQQRRIVSCCQRCHDTASMSEHAISFFCSHIPSNTVLHITNGEGKFHTLQSDLVAFTAGLIQQFDEHGALVQHGVLEVPARRVCRLHLRSGCKYGKDCKNVHLCSKLGEAVLSGGITAMDHPAKIDGGAAKRQPHAFANDDFCQARKNEATRPLPVFAPQPLVSKREPMFIAVPGDLRTELNDSVNNADELKPMRQEASPLPAPLMQFSFNAGAMDESGNCSSFFEHDDDAVHGADDATMSPAGLSEHTTPAKQHQRHGRHVLALDECHPCAKKSPPTSNLKLSDSAFYNFLGYRLE